MEFSDEEDNNMLEEDSNNKKSSDFYSKSFSKEQSSLQHINDKANTIIIKLKESFNSLDIIEQNIAHDEPLSIDYNEINHINNLNISFINEQNEEESFMSYSSIIYFINEIDFVSLLEKINF